MNRESTAADDCASLYRVIHARRDIRQFRPDPVPNEVLARILGAAHAAPSVGFMQPWNFILVRSVEIRTQIKASFSEVNAQELGELKSFERKSPDCGPDSHESSYGSHESGDRAALYGRLKLEGILESPLNIAVTCDQSRGGPFVLGRAPMPETDLFSTCLAVQNLWLAARAEGVGVGWVSILDRAEVERILGLPQHVRLVAYLCVGYPQEFRDMPLLEETGWRARLPLGELIFEDHWGQPPRAD